MCTVYLRKGGLLLDKRIINLPVIYFNLTYTYLFLKNASVGMLGGPQYPLLVVSGNSLFFLHFPPYQLN